MYKNLEIWKTSINLLKKVYIISEQLPKSEEYNLKSQLKRAITSVPLNIAEGKCRASSKEFAHFLNIASASLYEVDAILNICIELEFFNNIDSYLVELNILNKQINSLRNKLLENDA